MLGILMVVSGLIMALIILYPNVDCNNQVSNLTAIIFWVSFIVFILSFINLVVLS